MKLSVASNKILKIAIKGLRVKKKCLKRAKNAFKRPFFISNIKSGISNYKIGAFFLVEVD